LPFYENLLQIKQGPIPWLRSGAMNRAMISFFLLEYLPRGTESLLEIKEASIQKAKVNHKKN
jgi:hypothetical protein